MREILFGTGFVVLLISIAVWTLKQSLVLEKSYIKILPTLYEKCLTENKTIIYYGDFGYDCNEIKMDYEKYYNGKNENK
jgi:hypothetical protein